MDIEIGRNVSILTKISSINILQGCVATQVRCGGYLYDFDSKFNFNCNDKRIVEIVQQ